MDLARDQRFAQAGRRSSFQPRKGSVGRGLAIDVGTSTVRIGTPGRILVEEPAMVVRQIDGRIVAVGGEAREVLGRNPRGIEVIEPIDDAMITDINVVEDLLQRLLRRRGIPGTRNQRVAVVAVPLAAEGLHRRALLQCVQRSLPKAKLVPLEAPMAAAIGSDLPVHEAFGSMVVDVGRGVTEAAVVSLGAMITSRTAPVGGAAAVAAILAYVSEQYNLEIGWQTAERVVRFSSTARSAAVVVRGIDRATGRPRAIRMTRPETRAALRPVVDAIACVAKNALDAAPATLAADVMQGQILLTGGASRLDGLAAAIALQTGVAVRVRACPGRAVIDGARLCLDGPAMIGSPSL